MRTNAKRLIDFFRYLWLRPSYPKGTSWDSTVSAAGEEWVDDTKFSHVPVLSGGASVEELVIRILNRATENPDQDKLIEDLNTEFGLPQGTAIKVIDRALGGVVRAAALNPKARPDLDIDPVACIAFRLASDDHRYIDAIYPDWQDWEPGVHSDSPCLDW